VQIIQKNQRIKEKDAYKKEEERAGDKKVPIKKHKFTSSLTRGLRPKKGRTTAKANKVDKCRGKKYMEHVYLFS
jgi:hypothetical protein